MPSTTHELIRYLRGPALRVRTGLWLAPPGFRGHEAATAARLGVSAADARRPLMDTLLPGQTRLLLRESTLIRALDTIAQGDFPSDCCLVYNLDLLLAGLTSTARAAVWASLYDGFPHRERALLLAMPATAPDLLPNPDRLNQWRGAGRLAD